jgi:drug/metabolite transporter (DMT)-like permease
MLLSGFAFALMSAGVKAASSEVGTTMVVFFRNVVALLWLLPWLHRAGLAGVATRQLRGHLVRGLAGLGAMVCFFFAIGRMRLADAVLLNYSFPLFLPLAEWVWLREPAARGTWRSLVLGFAGVTLILKPGSSLFTAAAVAGVMAAVLAAVAQVGIRRLTQTEPVARIVFYFALIASAGSALVLPFAWRWPGGTAWAALVLTGTFATIGQFALTRAYAHAPAAMVAPFVYSGVVFAVLLDWIAWRQLPDPLFVPGALLVAAAGAWMLRQHPPAPGPTAEVASL